MVSRISVRNFQCLGFSVIKCDFEVYFYNNAYLVFVVTPVNYGRNKLVIKAIMFLIQWTSEYHTCEYWKHLKTGLFGVNISNGWTIWKPFPFSNS
jgi:hypothetical protein